MTNFAHKYYFDESVPAHEMEDTFWLAMLAVESLYGHTRALEESRFALDETRRTCVIDASSEVGRALALIFAGFAAKEYGKLLIKIERFLLK